MKRDERVAAVKIGGGRRKAAQKFWAPQQDHPALRRHIRKYGGIWNILKVGVQHGEAEADAGGAGGRGAAGSAAGGGGGGAADGAVRQQADLSVRSQGRDLLQHGGGGGGRRQPDGAHYGNGAAAGSHDGGRAAADGVHQTGGADGVSYV